MSAETVQRTAAVLLVTAAAYFWQLHPESVASAWAGLARLHASILAGAAHMLSFVWPPTLQSLPVLVVAAASFAVFVKRTFFSCREIEESKRVRAVKKRLLLAQMAQALRWNEGTEEEKGQKRPPSAKDVFEMLFDDVEERRVTDFGIASDAEPYASVWALFQERLSADLADAVRLTDLARQKESGHVLDGDEVRCLTEFRDGTKLQALLELSDKKVRKAFGRNVVDKALMREARECHRRLTIEQRKGVGMLWPLLQALLPAYLSAVVLVAFDSIVGCAISNGLGMTLDLVAAGVTTTEELQWMILRAYSKLVSCVVANCLSSALLGKVTSRFRLSVRSQIMANLVRQDMTFFDSIPSGILQERLNTDAELLASKIFELPSRVVQLVFRGIAISYSLHTLSRPLFATVLMPVPLISCSCYFIVKCMLRLRQRQRKIGEHVAANTTEVLKEIRTVREFAMEQEEAEKFAANSAYRAEVEEHACALENIVMWPPLGCLMVGTHNCAAYLGGVYVASGALTVGQAIQAASLAHDLQRVVRGFFFVLPDMVTALQPLGRICDLLSMKPKLEPHPGSLPKLRPESYRGAIEFKDIDFTFPAEPQKPILFKLSFSVAPGEKVGFVGATGSGKSTSIKLIERFYEPQGGSILLDGRPIGDYDVHHLREHMSVVAQDNTLFSTTIRENIIYGLPLHRRESITDAEIELACRKANAWAFVNDFPRKLETYAGERGVKLSGGQKQRLAIARAIVRKPAIILLDEATSALDSKAELIVKEALDKMITENAAACTIIIAHRLTTVKTCHKILVMDKGSIKESGRHEELMKIPVKKGPKGDVLCGWYRDLWETQHGKDEDDLQLLEEENHQLKEELLRVKADKLRGLRHFRSRVPGWARVERMPSHSPLSVQGWMLCHSAAKGKAEDLPPLDVLELERARTTEDW